MQILPADLHAFPWRIGWEMLFKDQRTFCLAIIFLTYAPKFDSHQI